MPTTTPRNDDDEPPRLAAGDVLPDQLRARTLNALGAAWTDLQRAAAEPVDLAEPMEMLGRARRIGGLDRRAKCMAVIALIVHGRSWREVAAGLGMAADDAEELYGEAVRRWTCGDPAPWLPQLSEAPEPIDEGSEVVA